MGPQELTKFILSCLDLHNNLLYTFVMAVIKSGMASTFDSKRFLELVDFVRTHTHMQIQRTVCAKLKQPVKISQFKASAFTVVLIFNC